MFNILYRQAAKLASLGAAACAVGVLGAISAEAQPARQIGTDPSTAVSSGAEATPPGESGPGPSPVPVPPESGISQPGEASSSPPVLEPPTAGRSRVRATQPSAGSGRQPSAASGQQADAIAGRQSSATAAEKANPTAGCQVTIGLTSTQLTAGESPSVFGELACPSSSSAGGQAITLYERQRSTGLPGFSIAGTATTETDGNYQFATKPLSAGAVFYVRAGRAHSTRVVARIAPQVSLSGVLDAPQQAAGASRDRARLQNTVTFTGKVDPSDPGAVVALQRENNTGSEEWHRVALGRVDGSGRYSITHSFGIPGEANVRVVVREREPNVASASEPLSYEFAQRQNPKLTIHASADPLSYGQQASISGVATGAAGQPITLLARAGEGSFVPVARTTTEGTGAYSFSDSPLQNTLYEVADAGATSTKLSEGVKYALSPTPPPTSVPAGSSLEVSGTVAPANAGDTIYLERQNPSGLGFRVVGVGSVTAGSTYSINHTFYGAAADAVLRIKIPRDADHQAAAGEPFDIAITPAPAVALGAEAPAEPLPIER